MNHLSEEYDAHWLFCALTIPIFVGISAYFDVYRRIKYMEDYVEPVTTTTKKVKSTAQKSINSQSSTGSSSEKKQEKEQYKGSSSNKKK